MRQVNEALSARRSVVVDNTNTSPAEWQPLIDAGCAHGATMMGCWFPPDPPGGAARNAAPDKVSRLAGVRRRSAVRDRPRSSLSSAATAGTLRGRNLVSSP